MNQKIQTDEIMLKLKQYASIPNGLITGDSIIMHLEIMG
jgi:hypothetical protein